MDPATVIRFLLGHGPSIDTLARSRSAIWTGLVLVLLTAIARQYDQTLITQAPVSWLFGSLAFSLVSGTWVYAWSYAIFARWWMTDPDSPRPGFWTGWPAFMGLFWMTAPIAWLYAVPVERFLDPVTAAKTNVGLLSIVSLWRVLLMSRVLHHLTRCPPLTALVWVLFPAACEVLVVFAMGNHFSQSLMASMGGMKNSPAEEVLHSAMFGALHGALIAGPVALVSCFFLKPRHPLIPFPSREIPSREFSARQIDAVPWKSLAAVAAVWIAVAIVPQIELWRTTSATTLMRAGRYREALDFLAARPPGDFAPAVPLPPKPFETDLFVQLPGCLAVVRAEDPAWLRAHLVGRMDSLVDHLANAAHFHRQPREELIIHFVDPPHFARALTAKTLLDMVDGLHRLPEGRHWLQAHPEFVRSIKASASSLSLAQRGGYVSPTGTENEWKTLAERLDSLFPAPDPK